MNNRTPGNLAQTAAGQIVQIGGLGNLTPMQKQHLQAYGLLPGSTVQILSQRPLTTILIEQTELAFETCIAREIAVIPLPPGSAL